MSLLQRFADPMLVSALSAADMGPVPLVYAQEPNGRGWDVSVTFPNASGESFALVRRTVTTDVSEQLHAEVEAFNTAPAAGWGALAEAMATRLLYISHQLTKRVATLDRAAWRATQLQKQMELADTQTGAS